MILDKIKSDVLEACKSEKNLLLPSFYDEHICVVVSYADILARMLGADKEIVEIASFLHDVSAVLDFATLPNHAVISSEIAETMLNKYQYPNEKIIKIKNSISKHKEPINLKNGTKEEVCVSNADAVSQIVNPTYWFYFAFKILNMNYEDGKLWFINRIKQNWELIIDEGKKLIEKRYHNLIWFLEEGNVFKIQDGF